MNRTPPQGALDLSHLTRDGHAYAYNLDVGLKRWRAALAKVQSSNDQIINVNAVCNSIGTGGVTTDFLTKGWLYLLGSAFASKFEDVGKGFLPSYALKLDDVPHWTYTGTWADETVFGTMMLSKQTSTNGSTASFTFTGTGITLVFVAGITLGKFNYAIDGGASVELDTYNATVMKAKAFPITGLSDAEHTIVITKNDDTKMIILLGAYPTKGTRGVRCNMVGKSGGSSSNAVGNESALYTEIDFWEPKLTIIEHATNEYAGQVALSTFKTNMQTLITRAKTFGDVLLLPNGLVRAETQTIHREAYLNVVAELAGSNNVSYIDMFNRWGGDYTYANTTLGMIYDTVHPNDVGHQDIANILTKVLIEY